MTKLYLIPGHGQGDSGAVGGGLTEADLVRRLASRIKELGGGEVETSDFSLNCYENSGMLRWTFPSGAQVVELHMDAADPSARGAHVIYKDGLEPDSYDRALAERLSAMMPGRANRLVGRSDLKNVNQAAIRGVPYRLVEHGFISNSSDREFFLSHIDDIARTYLDVFGISSVAADAPEVPAEPETPSPSGGIAEDGWWGSDTTRALQRALGTPEDGEVWGQVEANAQDACTDGWVYDYPANAGSPVIRALQERIGMIGKDVDGVMGPATIACLQKAMGTVSDGELWGPSPCVEEIQRRLNEGSF